MAERSGDFFYLPMAVKTVRGEFIAGVSIWPAEGCEGERPNFRNLGTRRTEEEAVRLASSYAEHWIDIQMRKRKQSN